MTDIQPVETPKPKRAKKVVDPLDGLTVKECAVGCTGSKCAITGKNVCGHPNKGGLQAPNMRNKKALSRFNEAKTRLAHAAVDKKG